jgi:putative two-component system response regulator
VPQLTEQAPPLGNIMIVDDNPANLKLLEDMLRQQRYEVLSFPRGRLALAAADQEPPDLILLDVNMPEMNGYEVCERFKSNTRLAGVPVIFLCALNATDKVKGFRSGGVDYIAKPFHFEEVQARVETHLKLRRAQQAEHDLLEKTLSGAVGTLWELVQLTSPGLASRCRAIRNIVLSIIERMAIRDPWQYELAATLCLLGCIALPDEVFEKAYAGQALSPDEDQMFRAHPESGARLLSNIPRLEEVAEMIRRQHRPPAKLAVMEPSRQGAHILHLAFELDRRVFRGVSSLDALAELRSWGRFDDHMLDALQSYSPAHAEFEFRRLPIREVRAGMIRDEDVFSKDGNLLILKAGTVLTETWIERLENFAKVRGVEFARVRISASHPRQFMALPGAR